AGAEARRAPVTDLPQGSRGRRAAGDVEDASNGRCRMSDARCPRFVVRSGVARKLSSDQWDEIARMQHVAHLQAAEADVSQRPARGPRVDPVREDALVRTRE